MRPNPSRQRQGGYQAATSPQFGADLGAWPMGPMATSTMSLREQLLPDDRRARQLKIADTIEEGDQVSHFLAFKGGPLNAPCPHGQPHFRRVVPHQRGHLGEGGRQRPPGAEVGSRGSTF